MAKQVTKTGLIRIYIRLTENEYAGIRQIAASENTDTSDWLRESVKCQLLQNGYDVTLFFDDSVSGGETNLATG